MSRLFALLALLAAGAVSAHAQVPYVPQFDRPRWGFGLALGPMFPSGAAGFGETTNRGFAAGISAQRFLNPSWSLGIEINQNSFGGVSSPPTMPVDGSFRIVGARFQTFHLTTRLNVISNESWTPYVGAGIGIAKGSSNILTGQTGGNQVDAVETQGASISARAGFETYFTNGLSFFAEGRYVQFRLDQQSGGPGISAVAIGALHIALGVRFWMDVKEKRR